VAVVMASSTRSADDLIRYVLEPKKGQQGERYVMASGTGGLLVSLAKAQMRDVRARWGKNQPGAYVQAYHVIQSFSAADELDPENPSDWMIAQNLGVALAEEAFPGRQVLVVTQRDGAGGCIHNHLVAASVETKTGASLNSAVVMHARLVETHEAMLEREGFEQPDNLKQAFTDALDRRDRGESSRLRRAKTKEQRNLAEATRHAQWQAERATAQQGERRLLEPFSLLVLKQRIDRAVAAKTTKDWSTFVLNAQAEGVAVERTDDGPTHVSFGMMRRMPDASFRAPTRSDRRRGSALGEEYTSTALETRIARNAEAMAPSGRSMAFVWSDEDEREVQARMAGYRAKLNDDRASSRPAVNSVPVADADSTDVSTRILASGPKRHEPDVVEAEPKRAIADSSPAPVSVGANYASGEAQPDVEISASVDAPQPTSTPVSDHTEGSSSKALDAKSTAEKRLRKLRLQASFDYEPPDRTGHELDL